MSDSISVRFLFFGATADAAGRRSVELELPADSPSKRAFDLVLESHPRLASHKLLFSINKQYATGDELLSDDDELAVFTAVSGG